MSETVLVAFLSFAGTLVGALGGIVVSAKLTNFRLQQLEQKVEKHNNFASRMPVVENEIEHMNEEIHNLQKYHQ